MLPFGLGYVVTGAMRSVNAILAHPLREALHLNHAEIGWVTSTFLLSVALAQVPLGILLDSWGARKTQALLFAVAGCGIVLFGLADDVTLLALGRAISGIGMAGGLMAAIKAISDWVERDEIPVYNSVILVAGGIGALAATTPGKLFELAYGWRTLCLTMGGLTLLAALLIFLLYRDKAAPAARGPGGLASQLAGLKAIYGDRFFWQVAPLLIFSNGGFIAMQGLWLGPWLEHVVGFTPLHSAHYLMAVAITMTVGMLAGGPFARLGRRTRLPLARVVALAIVVHIATQVVVALNVLPDNLAVWLLYGLFSQVTLVNYAVIAQHFGPQLSGRATTGANTFVFLFAFALQYAFGLVVHYWPGREAAVQPVAAYQSAFAALIVLEVLALLWFFASGAHGKYWHARQGGD